MASKDQVWQTSREVLDSNADPSKFFSFEEIEKDVFRSVHLLTTQQAGIHAAYGGLVFAQALAASELTVDDKLSPHAVHSFFILNVDCRVPVDYRVSRTRDGKSFCTRSVKALQKGRVVFSMQKEASPLRHQREMPWVKSPEECPEIEDAAKQLLHEMEDGKREVNESFARLANSWRMGYWKDNHLFNTRVVESEKYWGIHEDDVAHSAHTLHFWVKLRKCVGSDPKINRYLLAYHTDATLASAATRVHIGNGFRTSMIFSLDHNIWFHETDLRADDWLLYQNTSTQACESLLSEELLSANGRAFVEGRLWTRDGRLVLSTTQEVLIRTREPRSNL